MEKTLTYEEQVTIKNLLTHIKQHAVLMGETQIEIYKYINDINDILNKK